MKDKKSYIKGAFILSLAGIIVNVLGAFFRIPLGNKIGSVGMGYYQASFPIYVLLLTISGSGFPTAISKLVSQKMALNDSKGAFKIFKVSFLVLMSIGIISTLIIVIGAKPIVIYFCKNPKAYYSMIAIAPAFLFIPIMSTFKGYFQGRQEMNPTAISQIFEQVGRVFVGLYLAYVLFPKGEEFAAGGASFGGTAGAIFGTIAILVIYVIKSRKIKEDIKNSENYPEESTKQIIKNLLLIAVPITLANCILPIMGLVDTGVVMGRLQATGFSYDEAASLFGQLTGMAATLINFPQVITMSLAVSLVPVISHNFTIKDNESLYKNIKSGIKIAILIGLPASFGLASLSTPIMHMLYPSEPKSLGTMLLYLSMSVVLLGLIQVFTAILQGMENPKIPVLMLAIGVVAKVIFTFILTGIPVLNVKGAAIATVLSYAIICCLNFMYIKKSCDLNLSFKEYIIKPFVCVLLMTFSVLITYNLVVEIVGNALGVFVSIGIGIVIYGISIIVTNTISEEEMKIMPKGDKLLIIVKKIRGLK